MERIRSDFVLPIDLPGGAGIVELRRCDDHFFRKARSVSMPIELRSYRLHSLTNERGLGLPQIYAALTTLTGPSGDLYDYWKGAFAFPFKMTVRRGDREHRYLLKISNYRSMAEPALYRILRPDESYSISTYHPPFADELSEDDMLYARDFLGGFLLGYLKTMPRWTTPFVKEVRSNLILFGYAPTSGRFFEDEYKDERSYQKALRRWRTIIPDEPRARQMIDLDW